ncbi:TIGR04376 family protein [Leptolyngbya sp. FACHB-36]|uniref:TIGR04376 family protein n=1 Tax=Leptolyngbya sp. FACHB-36 TaxID=2692808 RepID=UPI00168185DA|nr:TIGR04376 family protein [Leptolyngbya sp. FACHB-36]MBD2022710.1 TIGR04376 family protein [Leptolyngbya sp. FACHB-36]
MGLFDDFSKFLETQLEEFLRNNPHLELMVLEEKLREQEEETLKLMSDLKHQEKQLQDDILGLAREIQLWHARIDKAKAAGRVDLAEPAQAHEAVLLRQGNQKWGQMEMMKQRIQQTQDLQRQIEARRKEVQQQVTQAQTTRTSSQTGPSWEAIGSSSNPSNSADLEQQFRRWEAEQDLEQLKRNLGR